MLEQLLGDLGVLGRHHPVEELHDRHIDAEVRHHVGELDADRAGARDHDGAGQLVVEDLLLVGDNVLGELGAGHQPRRRAGGDDHVVAGDLAVPPSSRSTSMRLGVVEGAPAVDLGDLVLLHQEVDALDDGVRHLAAARVGRREVHRGVAGDPELVLLVAEDVRSSALRSSALDGMQPTLRQTPPQYCFSTTATSCRAGRRGWRRRTHQGPHRGRRRRSDSRARAYSPTRVVRQPAAHATRECHALPDRRFFGLPRHAAARVPADRGPLRRPPGARDARPRRTRSAGARTTSRSIPRCSTTSTSWSTSPGRRCSATRTRSSGPTS